MFFVYPYWPNHWGAFNNMNIPESGYNKPCRHIGKSRKEIGQKNKKRVRNGLKVKCHRK